MHLSLAAAFSLFTLLPALAGAQSTPDGTISLADMVKRGEVELTQAWGNPGFGTAVVPPDGRAPAPLRIGDMTFTEGIGSHAPAEIWVELDGRFVSFEALVGVQPQAMNQGSVGFEAYVDGEQKFASQVFRERDEPVPIQLDLSGASELRLVMTDGGDGISCDCANLANALFKTLGNAEASTSLPFDAAPFGRIVSTDPSRAGGTAAGRVDSFPPEDLFLDQPLSPKGGVYELAPWPGGKSAIGVSWWERRKIRSATIHFAEGTKPLPADQIQFQFWSGESIWQGKWIEVEAVAAKVTGRSMMVSLDETDALRIGTERIRWVLPERDKPYRIEHIEAMTTSRMAGVTLQVQSDSGRYEERGHIELTNGWIGSPTQGARQTTVDWDRGETITLPVTYTRPRKWKSDRTLVRFSVPGGGFTVAVEDILQHGVVRIPTKGVTIWKEGVDPKTEAQPATRSVLDDVRSRPDQTFQKAFEHVHRPIQNAGPMLISAACDNWKFVTDRDASVQFDLKPSDPHSAWGSWRPEWRMRTNLQENGFEWKERSLDGEWTPIPVTVHQKGNLVVRQRSWVEPAGEPSAKLDWVTSRPTCWVEFELTNTGTEPQEVDLSLTFEHAEQKVSIESQANHSVVLQDGRPIAWVGSISQSGTEAVPMEGGVRLTGNLASGATSTWVVQFPGWAAAPSTSPADFDAQRSLQTTRAYWESILDSGTQIHVPDPFLENVYRASVVHCLLAARYDPENGDVSAWIASDRYGPLESEAHSVILGMAGMGFSSFAERGLTYFVRRYRDDGSLTTGYTLAGTGWHLWTLARCNALAQNSDWLKGVAPRVTRVLEWIESQRAKTMRMDSAQQKVPEYGFMPPGVMADWNRYAYRFMQQGHFLAGLRDAAAALESVGFAGADQYADSARGYQEDILRAYRWQQERTPVVRLKDGTWIPPTPSTLYCFGPCGEMFPGEDGNRSWCYDVELGGHHLIAFGAIAADGPEAEWTARWMEDDAFLETGMGEYPAAESEADPYNLGGFAKVQPYYGRLAEAYAMGDQVKPYIRSYFNAIPSLLSKETLSFWEHFHNIAAWNKTHETGWFLWQSRLLFAAESGNDLRVAPFVPTEWMDDGETVMIENLPTTFGPISFEIRSQVNRGVIEATLEPPTREVPGALVLRLRHPNGKPAKAVKVNGQPHPDFDPVLETVRIPGKTTGKIEIRAEY